jgi:hypothetical protein
MGSKKDIPRHHHSPDLEAVFVEQILQACLSQASLSELRNIIRGMMPSLSTHGLKKYLFYLTEYYLITYHGQNQVFVLTCEGLDLLYMIKKEKKTSNKSIKDIIITLE